jgi:hypothetical protein
MIRCILDSDGTLLCPRFFRSWYSSYACLAGVAQERNQEIPHPRTTYSGPNRTCTLRTTTARHCQ